MDEVTKRRICDRLAGARFAVQNGLVAGGVDDEFRIYCRGQLTMLDTVEELLAEFLTDEISDGEDID